MPSAAAAGTVTIGGDLVINRLGFGGMRIVGPGVMGPPRNLEWARATVRSLPELGVNFIDTANSYGPLVSELLVREALHPYPGMVVSTKGGCLRPAPGKWLTDCRPASLRTAVLGSLNVLGVQRLDLWHLHRIDPNVPRDEQFAAIAELQREGLIRNIGLSNVKVDDIDAAAKHFKVAVVQNSYHVILRESEDVLMRCERDRIPFIAYYPLATGALALPDSILVRVAERFGMTPAQAALAWLLKRSKWIVAIPGTQNPAHVRENVAAASIQLTDEQYAEIERVGKKAAMLRAPKT